VTWFRVDDGFWSHPKVVGLSDGAIATWLRAGTYSCQHLTDGFIAKGVLRLVGDKDSAAQLVEADLWNESAGGWQFHDWAEYQETSVAVKDRRAAARERQRKSRAAREAKKAAGKAPSGAPASAQTGDVTPPVTRDSDVTSQEVSEKFLTPDPTEGRVGTTSLPPFSSAADATESTSPISSATHDRAGARESGGALVPVRPPRGGREVAQRWNETAHTAEAHGIARRYAERVGPVPGQVLSEIGMRVDECLQSGVAPEQIAQGLMDWHGSKISATSQIPSFVHKAGATPAKQHGQSKPSRAAGGAIALAEEMIAKGLTNG
jgi:hypothetical protein